MKQSLDDIRYTDISYKVVSPKEAIDVMLSDTKDIIIENTLRAQWVEPELIDEILLKIKNSPQLIVVSGAFFWDEAKGKVVAALIDHPNVSGVIRANSGANAGHTVVHNGKKYAFHIMPSGILSGKLCIIGSWVVMDPATFYEQEIQPLLESGIDLENLKIGNCDIVFPWHKVDDLLGELNTSTGQGMRQVHMSKVAKQHVKLDEVINEDWKSFEKSYDFFMAHLLHKHWSFGEIHEKIKLHPNYSKFPKHLIDFLSCTTEGEQREYTKRYLRDYIQRLQPYRADTQRLLAQVLLEQKVMVVEWPQSFYLSNGNSIHPSSATSAQVDASGILATLGAPKESLKRYDVINVTKIPSSRVWSGANPAGYVEQNWFAKRNLNKTNLPEIDFNNAYKHFLALIDRKTGLLEDAPYKDENGEEVMIHTQYAGEEHLTVLQALAIASNQKYDEFGTTTGKPRVCGSLDLPHMAHVAKFQGKRYSLSRLDGLDGFSEVAVVIGYKYVGEHEIFSNGRIYKSGDVITLEDQLPNEKVLAHCLPIYKVLSGWKTSKWIQEGENLPRDLAQFILSIERLTGVEFFSLWNGKDTKELMHITQNKVKKYLSFDLLHETFDIEENGYLPIKIRYGKVPRNTKEAEKLSREARSIISLYKSRITSLLNLWDTLIINEVHDLMGELELFIKKNRESIDENFWPGKSNAWIQSLQKVWIDAK